MVIFDQQPQQQQRILAILGFSHPENRTVGACRDQGPDLIASRHSVGSEELYPELTSCSADSKAYALNGSVRPNQIQLGPTSSLRAGQ